MKCSKPSGAHCSWTRSRRELRTDLDDPALIKWTVFVQFAVVSDGELFGLTDDDAVREMMRSFLAPSLGWSG